jgi:hypothetical protein
LCGLKAMQFTSAVWASAATITPVTVGNPEIDFTQHWHWEEHGCCKQCGAGTGVGIMQLTLGSCSTISCNATNAITSAVEPAVSLP